MKFLKMDIEGVDIAISPKDWKETHGITLCCAILNEEKELNDFIEWHKPHVDNIAIVDGGSKDNSFSIASKHTGNVKIIKFAGHFGNQKNRAIEMAKNDWVLFLDPDERLTKKALEGLRGLVNQDEFDCYSFPRENYVDGLRDASNDTDDQTRLFRSYCRYIRPVHEEAVGFKKRRNLQVSSGMAIEHRKGSSRHGSRNNNYLAMQAIFIREMGMPGYQTESTYEPRLGHLDVIVNDMKKAMGGV